MKKNSYLSAALCALTLPAMAATANVDASRLSSELFRFAPKAKVELAKEAIGNPRADISKAPAKKGTFKVNAAKSIERQALPTATLVGTIDGPKGEAWYYVGDYLYDAKKNICGFALDIYDASWTKIGSIKDDIELKENETRVAEVSIGPAITQKFFNYDLNYEIMIGVAVNTTAYVNAYSTRVYAITPLAEDAKSECIKTIDGYYVSAIDAAADAWSENYYITFMTETETETPDINGVMNSADYRFITYKKADYNGNLQEVLDCRIPMLTQAGSDAVPFLATVNDGVPYFITNNLKYCWYLDPFDYQNDAPTPDNELIVNIYAPESMWSSAATLYSTTRFPLEATIDNLVFLYVGAFQYDADIDMARSGDGTPTIYLTRAHSHQGGDTYTYDYEVYTGAAKGQDAEGTKMYDIISGVDGGYFMTDVEGFDPQVMFLFEENGVTKFYFVSTLTGDVEHVIPANFNSGDAKYSMNTTVDRIPHGDSYLYVAPQTTGFTEADGTDHVYVVFASPEGDVVDVDNLNMGVGIDYATIFSDASAFNPYLFNLDSDREYMVLMKRRDQGSTSNHEEFSVISANPEKGIILTAGPDEEFGQIIGVELCNPTSDNPNLIVLYYDPIIGNWQYTLTHYDLPLTLFDAGEGTAESPYQITSVGGLMQIKAKPDAYYVVVNDIDADGVALNLSNFNFTGVLDGGNHVISNLTLNGHSLLPRLSGATPTVDEEGNASATESDKGVVKNLKFYNATLNATSENQGLVVGQLSSGRVYNVHAYNSTVKSTGNVGGLVGGADSFSAITECTFCGTVETQDYNSAGGIVCTTATQSSVSACTFRGTLIGGTEVGGIIGYIGSNGLGAVNCHVSANITGKYSIGGIVGTAARVPFYNNHVEGTLTATECPQWGGGAQVGGIAGVLPASYGEETAEVKPLIYNNFVNLSSITAPEAGEGGYATQNTTVHRVVGSSSANMAEMIDATYDPTTWEPIYIYGDPMPADAAIVNNYAISTLPIVDSTIADDLNSTEGKSVAASELGKAFFQEQLSFAYGSELSAPWAETSTTSPCLYFEDYIVAIEPANVKLAVDEEVAITIVISGTDINEDLVSGFTCEYNESLLEITDMQYVENGILIAFKGLSAGECDITVSLYGKTAKAHVTVEDRSGVEDVITEKEVSLTYDGTVLASEGAQIEVYSLSGVKVLAGYDAVATESLNAGIYVAVAQSADGAKTLKFCVK